jgi:multidrug resistance efflux pump
MNTLLEDTDQEKFAIRQDYRNLRGERDAANEPDAQVDSRGPDVLADSTDPLEAFERDFIEDARPRVDSINDSRGEQHSSGGGPWYKQINRRMLLVALLLLAVVALWPFAWNYLQSYESTDDAQVDGHIDSLSSRIDGTVIRVYAEDDDRVKKGELLVEIDPRDYEVAVEQAKAHLGLAVAQVASAKQDYAAALANIREEEAANFRAQRDARRYAILLERQVVPQEQYDQFIATARVDAAKVDSARQAAVSVLKTIAAREAEANAARAALDQALLNLSYTGVYAPANGIVGKRSVQLGSRIQPGQTLMFVTETDEIWVTANFKETQLARMHRGEKATIRVDTFGRNYQGLCREHARRQRRSLQSSAPRERHRQLREGRPTSAREDTA